MTRFRGFTLIELLIVVAIIAILAAIAIPNFLEAQIRSKVSSVKSEMASLDTAIVAYSVDHSQFPVSRDAQPDAAGFGAASLYNYGSLNDIYTINDKWEEGSQGMYRVTFGNTQASPTPNAHFYTLTTPISYIVNVPDDIFADTRGCNYGYANVLDLGWILWSYGPDADEKEGADLDVHYRDSFRWTTSLQWAANTVYSVGDGNASGGVMQYPMLIGLTYDPSNGSISDGDVWRVHGAGFTLNITPMAP